MDSDVEIAEVRNADGMAQAFAIRRAVFCVEQGVSDAEEVDGLDDLCTSYLASLNGRAVGTMRVRPLAGDTVKLERVAVLQAYRGQGIGGVLMRHAIARAAAKGVRRLVLNAQCQAEFFYAGLGFLRRGAVFEEAGIPHIAMNRDL